MQPISSRNRFDPEYAAEVSRRIIENVSKIIVGKVDVIKHILVTLYSGGHVLLEGVPGVAKTLIAKTIARSIVLTYSRIQATPDLLPSDIIGTMIFDPRINDFKPRKGPIFANIVLFDEINRASPRTQSALLEAMQEKQVTIEGVTFKLPSPFMVIATMNPIEIEGTFPLSEAQVDRFLSKIIIGYPSVDETVEILERYYDIVREEDVEPVLSPDEILEIIDTAKKIRADKNVLKYIALIVEATRSHKMVRLGASPRGAIALLLLARGIALVRGRDYITPDDIKYVAHAALRHRIMLTGEAMITGLTPDKIIDFILERVEVP